VTKIVAWLALVGVGYVAHRQPAPVVAVLPSSPAPVPIDKQALADALDKQLEGLLRLNAQLAAMAKSARTPAPAK
jgi:hypothetical protein